MNARTAKMIARVQKEIASLKGLHTDSEIETLVLAWANDLDEEYRNEGLPFVGWSRVAAETLGLI
jgi:hypothetical protein